MTSDDIDKQIIALRGKPDPYVVGVKAKDAASILLIDRSSKPKVLMGCRGSKHVFMPNLYVFPGGRRDPRDHALPYSGDLHPLVMEKLLAGNRTGMGQGGARALALAALRELSEETGIRTPGESPQADLSRLRYVARAITPPGNVRRFDTRFFLAFSDEMQFDFEQLGDSGELQDVRWLDMDDLASVKMAFITRTVLDEVNALLTADPSFPFGNPVPFYFMRHWRLVRSRL